MTLFHSQTRRNVIKGHRGFLLFEVNTKNISLSALKTSEFSRVRSTIENFYVFNSRDDIYLVFTEKSKFSFILYFFF